MFKNFLIARDKFQPDYFLYENNKSMSKEIKEQIAAEFGFEPVLINSALVSAQNRQRLYWLGKREADGSYSKIDVQQPEDRGILLRDVLDIGVDLTSQEKSYCLTSSYNPCAWNTIERHQKNMVAVPIRVGCMPSPSGEIKNSQAMRIYSTDGKAVNQNANSGGVGSNTGLYAVPVACRCRGRNGEARYECRSDEKSNTLDTNTTNGSMVAEPCCDCDGYGYDHICRDCVYWDSDTTPTSKVKDGKTYPVYEVKDGNITIKGKTYPIKLLDGFYIIRKLSVAEYMRLQTVPEWYEFPVSNSQSYKMLGNGWTVEVVKHLLSHCDGITTESLEVLSMYGGMECGQIALKDIGATITKVWYSEIDKYAIKTVLHNFPNTILVGDAFSIRTEEWKGIVYD